MLRASCLLPTEVVGFDFSSASITSYRGGWYILEIIVHTYELVESWLMLQLFTLMSRGIRAVGVSPRWDDSKSVLDATRTRVSVVDATRIRVCTRILSSLKEVCKREHAGCSEVHRSVTKATARGRATRELPIFSRKNHE